MAVFGTASGTTADDLDRALDPSVRGADLVALAAHRDVAVRRAVASRADAPMASLISLAHERDAFILEALAANPSSPSSVLLNLVRDRRARVRDLAAARLTEIQYSDT